MIHQQVVQLASNKMPQAWTHHIFHRDDCMTAWSLMPSWYFTASPHHWSHSIAWQRRQYDANNQCLSRLYNSLNMHHQHNATTNRMPLANTMLRPTECPLQTNIAIQTVHLAVHNKY
jgi:hypothetical protein